MDPSQKQTGSSKKNKQKNNKQIQLATKIEQQETFKLVEKKLEEFEKQAATQIEDPNVKEIKQLYKKLTRALTGLQEEKKLSLKEKFNFVFELGQNLGEQAQKFEEETYLYKRQLQIEKQDTQLQKEYNNNLDVKNKLEFHCKDLQKKLTQLNDIIVKVPEEEQAKRDEIQKTFGTNIFDVKDKIDIQEKEANEFEIENQILRDELQVIIASYEQREKEFWDIVKQKEDTQKNETTKYLEKFEQMQINAQQVIQQKLRYETGSNLLKQKKMKLAMYKGKFTEFLDTLDKSYNTIVKLKEELIKMATQLKQKEQKYAQQVERSERADRSIVIIMQKTDEAKKSVELVKKEKERVKSGILEVQKKLKEQESQKNQEK